MEGLLTCTYNILENVLLADGLKNVVFEKQRGNYAAA